MLKPNSASAHRRIALSTRSTSGHLFHKIENIIVGKFQHNPVSESDYLGSSSTGCRSDADLGGCRSAIDLEDDITEDDIPEDDVMEFSPWGRSV